MKPYLVTVVLQPTRKQVDEGTGVTQVVVPAQTVLARDESSAKMKAGRLVPEEYTDVDDRLEVYVLPFGR